MGDYHYDVTTESGKTLKITQPMIEGMSEEEYQQFVTAVSKHADLYAQED